MQETDKFEERFIDHFEQELLFAHDPVTTDAERIQNIVESKYCPADLKGIVKECKLLTSEEQHQLLNLLNKFKDLFDGTLGTWNTDPVELELKEGDCKPYHSKPYPVPYSQEQQLKEENRQLHVFFIFTGKEVPDYKLIAEKTTIALQKLEQLSVQSTS